MVFFYAGLLPRHRGLITTRIMAEVLIILAGGKQTRWGQYSSKMLAPVLGLPLIRRTCAQLRRTGQPRPCGFDSRSRHHPFHALKIVKISKPDPHLAEFCLLRLATRAA